MDVVGRDLEVVQPSCLHDVMAGCSGDGVVCTAPGHKGQELGDHEAVVGGVLYVLPEDAPAIIVRSEHVVIWKVDVRHCLGRPRRVLREKVRKPCGIEHVERLDGPRVICRRRRRPTAHGSEVVVHLFRGAGTQHDRACASFVAAIRRRQRAPKRGIRPAARVLVLPDAVGVDGGRGGRTTEAHRAHLRRVRAPIPALCAVGVRGVHS
eukprot:586414-Prymnesium_polylepis.1